MNTLTSVKININGSDTSVFVYNNEVMIETKKGSYPVIFVNKASKTIVFSAGEKEIYANFTGDSELVNALFNATKKGCALVSFGSYEQYLKERDQTIGSDFDAGGIVCAYKYA